MIILCLFIPSFFAIYLYKKFNQKATAIELLIRYGMYVFFSNLISFVVLILMSDEGYILSLEASPLTFIVKILLLNFAMNLVIFIFFSTLEKKIELRLEFTKSKKEQKHENS